jgi:hypothetical protein
MKAEEFHCGNLTGDAVDARNSRRIWEARDNSQSNTEGCFKDTVRTALCNLCKECNIGTRTPVTQLFYVEKKSSLREAQMFVVTLARV